MQIQKIHEMEHMPTQYCKCLYVRKKYQESGFVIKFSKFLVCLINPSNRILCTEAFGSFALTPAHEIFVCW